MAVEVLPWLEKEAKERQLATLKKGDKKPVVEPLPEREKGEAREQAAKLVGGTSACYICYSTDRVGGRGRKKMGSNDTLSIERNRDTGRFAALPPTQEADAGGREAIPAPERRGVEVGVWHIKGVRDIRLWCARVGNAVRHGELSANQASALSSLLRIALDACKYEDEQGKASPSVERRKKEIIERLSRKMEEAATRQAQQPAGG